MAQTSPTHDAPSVAHPSRTAQKAAQVPPAAGVPEMTAMERPKRPVNSFMQYRSKYSKEQQDQKTQSVVLGAEWKTLSAEEKAPYEAQAAENKRKHDEEVAKWHEWLRRNNLPIPPRNPRPRKTGGKGKKKAATPTKGGGCGEGGDGRPTKRRRTSGPCDPSTSASASSSRSSSALGSGYMHSTPSTSGGNMMAPPYINFDGAIPAHPQYGPGLPPSPPTFPFTFRAPPHMLQHYQLALHSHGSMGGPGYGGTYGRLHHPYPAPIVQTRPVAQREWPHPPATPAQAQPPTCGVKAEPQPDMPIPHTPVATFRGVPYPQPTTLHPYRAGWDMENIPLEGMIAQYSQQLWYPVLPMLPEAYTNFGVEPAAATAALWANPEVQTESTRTATSSTEMQHAVGASGSSDLSALDDILEGFVNNSVNSALDPLAGMEGMDGLDGGDAQWEALLAHFTTQGEQPDSKDPFYAC